MLCNACALDRSTVRPTEPVLDLQRGVEICNLLQSSSTSLASFKALTKVMSKIGPVFGVLASALPIFSGFYPDYKHQEILDALTKINENVNLVREDVRKLNVELKYQTGKLHYVDKVATVRTSIEYSKKILEYQKANNTNLEKLYKDKLMTLCEANLKCQEDLKALLKGIYMYEDDDSTFNIFSSYYEKTGGHRNKMAAYGVQWLKVISGGVLSVLMYERIRFGEKATKILANQLQPQINKTVISMNAWITKCENENEFRKNMLRDLEAEMAKPSSIRQVSEAISDSFGKKYDFLMVTALVYSQLSGFDNHIVGGSYIHIFRHNGKNAVVFYHYPIGRQSRILSPSAIGFRMLFDALTDPNFKKCQKVAKEANSKAIFGPGKDARPRYSDEAEEVYCMIANDITFGTHWLGLAVVRRWGVEKFVSSCGYQKRVWDEGRHFDVLIIVR